MNEFADKMKAARLEAAVMEATFNSIVQDLGELHNSTEDRARKALVSCQNIKTRLGDTDAFRSAILDITIIYLKEALKEEERVKEEQNTMPSNRIDALEKQLDCTVQTLTELQDAAVKWHEHSVKWQTETNEEIEEWQEGINEELEEWLAIQNDMHKRLLVVEDDRNYSVTMNDLDKLKEEILLHKGSSRTGNYEGRIVKLEQFKASIVNDMDTQAELKVRHNESKGSKLLTLKAARAELERHLDIVDAELKEIYNGP